MNSTMTEPIPIFNEAWDFNPINGAFESEISTCKCVDPWNNPIDETNAQTHKTLDDSDVLYFSIPLKVRIVRTGPNQTVIYDEAGTDVILILYND